MPLPEQFRLGTAMPYGYIVPWRECRDGRITASRAGLTPWLDDQTCSRVEEPWGELWKSIRKHGFPQRAGFT